MFSPPPPPKSQKTNFLFCAADGKRKDAAVEDGEPGKKVSVKKQLLDWCSSVLNPANITVNTFQEWYFLPPPKHTHSYTYFFPVGQMG